LRQLWFYLAAVPLVGLRRSPALFIAQTNPPLVVVLVALISMLHRTPLMIVAMDLYPEVIFAHGLAREDSRLGRLLEALFRFAYRRAAIVVALGPTMRERLEDKGVAASRIVEISNWATGDLSVVRGADNRLRQEWGLEGACVLLYSGNLGVAHEVESVVRAFAEALPRCPRLRLVFVAKGQGVAIARELVERLGVQSSVQFHDLVPTDRLPESLGLADVALVTLRPGFEGLVVPSKLLGCMARGLPTVYVGPPSDAAALLERSGGGVSFGIGAVSELAQFFVESGLDGSALRSMGQDARAYYERELSREVALAHYREAVERATSGRRPGSGED
jgi:glycosyltransferase involved in cell wall biosynthesis